MSSFDYSVYDKSGSKSFSISNPKPKLNNDTIRIKIVLFKRNKQIIVNKDISLEDLYLKIYNSVYPEFSTEKVFDSIPPPDSISTYKFIPRIYFTSVIDDEQNILSVPNHKFITLSSYMTANPKYFKNISYIGTPTFRIYVVDEEHLNGLKTDNLKNERNYLKRFVSCYSR